MSNLQEQAKNNHKVTPMRSIRGKCLDCSNFQTKEVRECPVETCSLYPYRMGRRPTGMEVLQTSAQGVAESESVALTAADN